MIEAILYTTNTGTSEQYARMLGEKLKLPVHPLKGAPVPKGAKILYVGWVMASGVQGYRKASQQYRVEAVCAVCMGETGSQLAEIRKQNAISQQIPVFTLQGGFDMKKLRGVYRFMMSLMEKTLGKKLAEKPDKTAEEADMLDMLLHGGNRVSEANLSAVLSWYHARA